MSEKTKETNQPTHAIWQVQGERDKARWNRVGAAWVHKDLKGAGLKFDAFPMSGRIVIREITEQDDAGDQPATASQGGQQ